MSARGVSTAKSLGDPGRHGRKRHRCLRLSHRGPGRSAAVGVRGPARWTTRPSWPSSMVVTACCGRWRSGSWATETRWDDVLQDVALKAFAGMPRFRGEASLTTWLYRITYTTCLNRLRGARPTVSLSDPSDDRQGRLAAGSVIGRHGGCSHTPHRTYGCVCLSHPGAAGRCGPGDGGAGWTTAPPRESWECPRAQLPQDCPPLASPCGVSSAIPRRSENSDETPLRGR